MLLVTIHKESQRSIYLGNDSESVNHLSIIIDTLFKQQRAQLLCMLPVLCFLIENWNCVLLLAVLCLLNTKSGTFLALFLLTTEIKVESLLRLKKVHHKWIISLHFKILKENCIVKCIVILLFMTFIQLLIYLSFVYIQQKLSWLCRILFLRYVCHFFSESLMKGETIRCVVSRNKMFSNYSRIRIGEQDLCTVHEKAKIKALIYKRTWLPGYRFIHAVCVYVSVCVHACFWWIMWK